MDSIISGLLATMPTGLWEKIIVAFENAFGSFALSIIVLTVIIKLVMSPIDFFNRRTNKKMATMQQKVKGQVEALNKKYANDKKTLNQKLGELYQREKINPMGSCFTMLINLGLTFAIFITLLNGMNAMASYKIATEFETLQTEYVASYVSENGGNIYDEITANPDKSIYEICKPYIEQMNAIENEETKNGVLAIANENVAKKHKEIKEGFLWIDNIWIADSPFQNSIPSFDSYAGTARLTKDQKTDEYRQIYEQIMNPLRETNGRANGYFILLILCAGLSFLNQWLMMKKQKEENPQAPTNKAMLFIMPIFMGIFTLFYTTMFALYLVSSQLVSIGLTPLINLISDKCDKRQQAKQEDKNTVKRMERVVTIKEDKTQPKQSKKSNKSKKSDDELKKI